MRPRAPFGSSHLCEVEISRSDGVASDLYPIQAIEAEGSEDVDAGGVEDSGQLVFADAVGAPEVHIPGQKLVVRSNRGSGALAQSKIRNVAWGIRSLRVHRSEIDLIENEIDD